MKSLLTSILTLLLALSALPSQAQNKIDSQGRRQGHWIKTDKDGSRIFEGDFENGLEVGEFRYFYPDGTLKIRNTFITPGRLCRHEAFDEKGHLLASGYYNQKNRDSIWLFYNEEGTVVKKASYRMGIKEGEHIVFSPKGDTVEITTWYDNRRDGRWWKRIGEKGWISARYEKGLMQGRLLEYNDNGQLVREGLYKDGAKNGSYRYYENGIRTVDETWVDGSLADRKVLLHAPQERWVSTFGIAYYLAKGQNGTFVYLNDGSKLTCSETAETVGNRVGGETFVLIDKNNRVMANTGSIVGLAKDDDGRVILELDPKPPFTIFPDKECIDMVRSLQRVDQLDETE